MPNGGGSPPYMWIILVILVVLTWLFGWIVPVAAVALVILITIGVAIYDAVVHDKNCRWCNRIKTVLRDERSIDASRVKTQHVDSFATHMHVQVYIDGEPDVLVDIDFNEIILGVRPPAH